MVTLSSLNHTIGVFRRDNIYHVYDANFATGCAQKIEHIRTVKQCVLDRLYRVHGKPVDPIPLHITALHNGKCARGLPVAADTFIQKNDPLSQEGVNSLYLSCVNGDEVMVKKLLEKKGNVNQRFRDDMYSPLAIAALQNHPGLVKLLLQQKAKVNLPLKKNNTALHFAAECGYAPLIQKLLSQGAAVDQRNDDGQTPLEIAKDKEEWDIVRLMKRFS
jgi:ankyrin repeat protein